MTPAKALSSLCAANLPRRASIHKRWHPKRKRFPTFHNIPVTRLSLEAGLPWEKPYRVDVLGPRRHGHEKQSRKGNDLARREPRGGVALHPAPAVSEHRWQFKVPRTGSPKAEDGTRQPRLARLPTAASSKLHRLELRTRRHDPRYVRVATGRRRRASESRICPAQTRQSCRQTPVCRRLDG